MTKKIDNEGLLLCKLQAEAFAQSIVRFECSSEVFVRRFMNSSIVKRMDDVSILQTNLQAQDILDRVEEEYGVSNYGTVKYPEDELYWIGYLYRYFSYTYEKSSLQVYKIVKPKELRGLFWGYHGLDSAQAIERILEAKNLNYSEEGELQRQYQIFRLVREQSLEYGKNKEGK